MRIITHTDMDGVCSAALFMRKYGKTSVNITYATVKEAEQFSEAGVEFDFACDLPKVGRSINLDHHKSNHENLTETNRLTSHDRVDPLSASATDIVFDYLEFNEKEQIAREIKELGHLADTAQLPVEYRILDIVLNMNSDNNTILRKISELLAVHGKGILDTDWLKDQYKAVKAIFHQTHSRITEFINKQEELASIVILDVRNSINGKLAKEVVKPLFERGVSVLAVVYEKSTEDPVRVSFRVTKDKQPLYDVAIVAKAFGGGGHKMAAACSPPRETIPDSLIRELQKIALKADTVQYAIL